MNGLTEPFAPLPLRVVLNDLPKRLHSYVSYMEGATTYLVVSDTVLTGSPSWWSAVLRAGWIVWQVETLGAEGLAKSEDEQIVWLCDFEQTVMRYHSEKDKKLSQGGNKIKARTETK